MPPTPAIVVTDLVKRYKGADRNAVDGVSFSVEQGSLFALLGPNGAGKTTTISILTTTLAATSGSVQIAGADLAHDQSEVRRRVGIIFQKPSLDRALTGEENCRFHAALYGAYAYRPAFSLMPQEYRERVVELGALVGLDREDLHRRARHGQISLAARSETRDGAAQSDGGFGTDRSGGRSTTGYETVGLYECFGMVADLAVIAVWQDDVGRATQSGAVVAYAGCHALGAHPDAVRLRKFVVFVRADGQPLHARRNFSSWRGTRWGIQRREEWACSIKFAAGSQGGIGPNAVIGRASEYGVGNQGRAAKIRDVVADGETAAGIPDHHDFRASVQPRDACDLGLEVTGQLGRRAAGGLRDGIVVPGEWPWEIERVEAISGPAIGLEAPNRG